MMWLLLACAGDPDARLQRGDLAGAARAWEQRTGQTVDVSHPTAELLAQRARQDRGLSMAVLVDTMAGIALLERSTRIGFQALDLSFDTLEGLLAGADCLLQPPYRIAAGRAATRADADPVVGGPLPYQHGVFLGTATHDAAALGRAIDANPPSGAVQLSVSDKKGEVHLHIDRHDGAWWTQGASDAEHGAWLVLGLLKCGEQGR